MDAANTIVSLRRWTALAEVDRVLDQCLADLGGLGQIVKPGQMVVIKPNLTANAPSHTGGTTHVELVAAIVRQVQRCGAGRIVVGEGNGYFGLTLETAFRTGGWREMAVELGIELYNLDGGPYVEITLDGARYPHPLPFSQLVLNADVFISVPCLKTHAASDYTVALKNSYALTPQWKRSEIHRQGLLEESLVDLNRIRQPDLTVVDGWDGAEGVAGGTDFERPGHARLMLAGGDPVAVDIVSRELMDMRCRTRYLEWAIEDAVGIGDPEHIQVCGDAVADCRRHFMTPSEEMCVFLPNLTFHDRDACSGCRIAAVSAMNRFRYQKLLRPVQILFGKEGPAALAEGETLVLGDCAAGDAHCGSYIEGCPPRAERIVAALESGRLVCVQCRELVQEMLSALPQAILAHLRVTAAGAQVYMGERVKQDAWHIELLVGDCMQRYHRVVVERANQFGMDPERDILWVRGCPPTKEQIQTVLDVLERNVGDLVAAQALSESGSQAS